VAVRQLELVNGEPLTGPHEAAKVEALRASVAPDLFRGFDPDAFPATTIPALRVAHAAYERGLAEGERVSLLLRTALFEDGLDVADPAVLEQLVPGAREAVDDRSAPEVADWEEGRARGVEGSPHWFVGGASLFCPSMEIAEREGTLDIRFDDAGFEELVGRALA
jgi:hypothetical protein